MAAQPTNNNDDQFDTDFDNDAFKDYNDPADGRTLGALMASPIVKIGAVVGVLVVVVGGMMLFGGSGDNTDPSVVATPADVREPPGTAELNPAVRDAVEQFNEQNTEQALRSGESTMPVPTTTPQAPATFQPPTGAAEDDPLKQWRALQEQRSKDVRDTPITPQDLEAQRQTEAAKEQARVQAMNAMIDRMTAQMNSVLAGQGAPGNLKSFVVTQPATPDAENAAIVASADPFSADSLALASGQGGLDTLSAQTAQPPKILIPAGKIEYAQLLIEANSDIPGPIMAQIASGPFQGGRIIGSFRSSDEYIIMSFNTIIDRKGNSFPVNAVAIDPSTTLTGMATEVDRRWFSRVILPAAARFIEGTAQAAADSGTTSVSGADGVVQSSTRDVDFEQELFNGLEEAAQELGDELEREGNRRRVLVRVASGTPMGIFFLQPVQETTPQQALAASQGQGGFGQTGGGLSNLERALLNLNAASSGQSAQNPFGAPPSGFGFGAQPQAQSPFNLQPNSPFAQPSQFELQQQPRVQNDTGGLSDIGITDLTDREIEELLNLQ